MIRYGHSLLFDVARTETISQGSNTKRLKHDGVVGRASENDTKYTFHANVKVNAISAQVKQPGTRFHRNRDSNAVI